MAKATVDPSKAAEIKNKTKKEEKVATPVTASITESVNKEAEPEKEGKLAAVRRLRAAGFTREQILNDHKDSDGQPFHKTTVAIQCANVEKAKIVELGPNASDEEKAKWTPVKKAKVVKPPVEKPAKEPKPAKKTKAEKQAEAEALKQGEEIPAPVVEVEAKAAE